MLSCIQERAKASQGGTKGKLGKQLDAQRSQTQSEALKHSAADNRAARQMEDQAQKLQYN